MYRYTSFPIWRGSLGRVTLGESRAIPGDEKRRDNNISVSFSFEKYTFSVLWRCSLPTLCPHFDYPTIESDLPRNRTRLSFPLTGSDIQKSGPINLKRVRLLYRARFNNNSSPISFGIRSETYRTRLENGPDLLLCPIKRNHVPVNNSITQKPVNIRS